MSTAKDMGQEAVEGFVNIPSSFPIPNSSKRSRVIKKGTCNLPSNVLIPRGPTRALRLSKSAWVWKHERSEIF